MARKVQPSIVRISWVVPGARMIEIEGMGHDVPERVWQEVVDAIAGIADRAVSPHRR